MRLDVVVPTYNRVQRLRRTIRSLLEASVPAGHEVHVIVVDNNCTDGTAEMIAGETGSCAGRLHYVQESIQGLSAARNAGIRTARGELVGFVDDDETVSPSWFQAAFSAFERYPGIGFIGGPCQPEWECEIPAWLPLNYPAVVGRVEGPDREVPYGSGFPGILMAGNSVVRREVFDQVGSFDLRLGRTSRGLSSCEDEDLYQRFLVGGIGGVWIPALLIYHAVDPLRCTKRYHRQWSYGQGLSLGSMGRFNLPGVPTVMGIPRWMYRTAMDGFGRALLGTLARRHPATSFAGELACWNFAGYFIGRHFRRIR